MNLPERATGLDGFCAIEALAGNAICPKCRCPTWLCRGVYGFFRVLFMIHNGNLVEAEQLSRVWKWFDDDPERLGKFMHTRAPPHVCWSLPLWVGGDEPPGGARQDAWPDGVLARGGRATDGEAT